MGGILDTDLIRVGDPTNVAAFSQRRVEVIPRGRQFEVKLMERDLQSTIGLQVSNHDNPKMIGCQGNAMIASLKPCQGDDRISCKL